ncbi:hypothetical protein, partial [Promicromonospora kroppenstedtii]|uniref:hypothetical protein n=1 Tax=Promicromonospora kroppenstedtii TaxID=440482 RepID=UPI000567971B
AAAAGGSQSAPRTAQPADRGPASGDGQDYYDEPSEDDPDIVTGGLAGVSLVVQVLGGTVIDEIVEQS